jgi:tRNA pseudouridine65 synthase
VPQRPGTQPWGAVAALSADDGRRVKVLYLDGDVVAVHKPPGMLVHRGEGRRAAGPFALQIARDQLGRRLYPVHRLDRATSGVLLFALSAEAARFLGAAFGAGSVDKRYIAVVRGFTDEQGAIDYALREVADGAAPPVSAAADDRPAQPALTLYRRLATAELPVQVGRYPTARYSLLDLRPRTGRMHQIRRHLKHIAHPIIGDTTHGDGRHNRLFRERLGCARLLLAATGLTFPHPRAGRPVTVSASLDFQFRSVLRELGWEEAVAQSADRRPPDASWQEPSGRGRLLPGGP